MQEDPVDVNQEERFLNWWGIFLIVLGVTILALQNIWIAIGVVMVVVGNNYRMIAVIRAGMRHLTETTIAALTRLAEAFQRPRE
jgi:hypothetical protein